MQLLIYKYCWLYSVSVELCVFCRSLGKDEAKWTTMPPEYTVHKLEAASHYTIDNHFVGRLRGLFMAPQSAYYRFVIRGDDVSQLYFGNTGDDTNMVSLINVGSKEGKNLFPTLNPICDPNPNLKPQKPST